MANFDLDYEGSVVQDILDTGKELEDSGYIFKGTATPSTIPGTPTERVAYVGGPGTYNNFGTTVVVPSGSIVVITYSGSAWSKTVLTPSLPISTTLENNDTTIPTGKAVKTAIDAEATARGNADTALQNLINGIKANIDNGYVYAGIATPTGTPVTGKVFYIATAAGTYTNFGGQVLTQGINILKYNGSAWSSEQVIGFDEYPNEGSKNLVEGGGIALYYGIYTKSPNFVHAITDSQKRIYIGIEDNGNVLFGAGVPTQIIEYIQSKINELHLNRVDDIISFLDGLLSGDKTLSELLDEKVDGVYTKSPNFIWALTDSKKRVVIGVEDNSNVFFGAGVPNQIKEYINQKISELNLEVNDIVSFLDGLLSGDETLQDLLDEKVDGVYTKSPDFIWALTDSKKRVIIGARPNGKTLIDPEFTQLDGKKISLLGDSITTFDGMLVPNDIGLYSYYPSGNVQRWQDTYWGRLVANDNMILECNCASNGSMVSGNTDFAMCSDARLSLLGDPDVIIFYGGTNDVGAGIPLGTFNYDGDYSGKINQFKPAYAYCLYKMKMLYPKAVILCVLIPDYSTEGMMGRETDYPVNVRSDINGNFTFEYNNVIKELAAAYNCAVCDIGTSIPYFNRASFYIKEVNPSTQKYRYLHPNLNGMNVIYNRIKRELIKVIV